MGCVGDAQATHAVSVTPLSKVTLERLWALVRVVAADFAVIAYVQSV